MRCDNVRHGVRVHPCSFKSRDGAADTINEQRPLFSNDGHVGVFVIRAGDKYELLDSNDLGEMALATPALIGDRLILRTENHLYSIRKTPGNRRR